MFRVLVDARVEADFAAAPAHVRRGWLRASGLLEIDPFCARPGADIRRLKGLAETYRLRLGGWRVLYVVGRTRRIVRVTKASPRAGAYR